MNNNNQNCTSDIRSNNILTTVRGFLEGEKVLLRPLVVEDAYGNYPHWFNDANVSKGNSHHVFPYTQQEALEYIQSLSQRKDILSLAIIDKLDMIHIGNISLQNINFIYRSAELAIIIGEKSAWGKGYGKEASYLLTAHGFYALNMHRIQCATFSDNIGMQKIALHIGMILEGKRRESVYKNGRFLDIYEYGVLASEFYNLQQQKKL